MRVTDKKVLARHVTGRAPLCAGITYIDAEKPALLRRLGWEVSDDIHDGYTDSFSHDNGENWTEPVPALQSTPVDGGFITHTENAFLYLPDSDLLFHFTNDKFESSLTGGVDISHPTQVRITWAKPLEISSEEAEVFTSDFGLPQGIGVSFCVPIRDSRGRILVPIGRARIDEDGTLRQRGFKVREDTNTLIDFGVVALLIGEQDDNGAWQWRLGQSVPAEPEKSSRGMCEGAITELAGGRLVMVLRGSNAAWPDRPGYKWLTFSEDGGVTWSEVVPLECDDGAVFESSATGSTFIRSEKNGRLYWAGNLCLNGERAEGNFPRSPLYLAEVQEEPFALKRATITEIARHSECESPRVQHSNFKVCQDRPSGDLLFFFTRYGEHGVEGNDWLNADLHQYRVSLD